LKLLQHAPLFFPSSLQELATPALPSGNESGCSLPVGRLPETRVREDESGLKREAADLEALGRGRTTSICEIRVVGGFLPDKRTHMSRNADGVNDSSVGSGGEKGRNEGQLGLDASLRLFSPFLPSSPQEMNGLTEWEE